MGSGWTRRCKRRCRPGRGRRTRWQGQGAGGPARRELPPRRRRLGWPLNAETNPGQRHVLLVCEPREGQAPGSPPPPRHTPPHLAGGQPGSDTDVLASLPRFHVPVAQPSGPSRGAALSPSADRRPGRWGRGQRPWGVRGRARRPGEVAQEGGTGGDRGPGGRGGRSAAPAPVSLLDFHTEDPEQGPQKPRPEEAWAEALEREHTFRVTTLHGLRCGHPGGFISEGVTERWRSLPPAGAGPRPPRRQATTGGPVPT